MNIKLTLEYDGTHYHGWQLQPNGETIQAVLEKAISTFLGTSTRIIGSGRTDAGVHALGQVANFFCNRELHPAKLRRGLNALTPSDVIIRQVEFVPDSFDARRNARSRVYQYRILNRAFPSAFHHRYAWFIRDRLQLIPMKEAIVSLEGEHDFSSFQAAGCDAAHAVRRVYHNSLAQEGDFLLYTIEATAFLRHMVRNIVGTLVEVGRNERSPEAFARLLEASDRTRAGATAPPHGLFLMEVKY